MNSKNNFIKTILVFSNKKPLNGILILILFFQCVYSQNNGKKKIEMALNHFDSVQHKKKYEAVKFLIQNLDIHKSVHCEWKNSKKQKIDYNELDYKDYPTAKKALKKFKDSLKIHPRLIQKYDINNLSNDYLIKNTNKAFELLNQRPWAKNYSTEIFYEYLLPYRSLIEPLEENWREKLEIIYTAALNNTESITDPVEICTRILGLIEHFNFIPSRPTPQPLLSLSQLTFRRQGTCPDLANYAIMVNRALGVATTLDFTPHYAASSNRHFWNTVVTAENKHIPFNGNKEVPYEYDPNQKRLGKVLRRTFSKQKSSLASKINPAKIPSIVLKTKNIKDVTSEYVPSSDIKYRFATKNNIGYITVFNQGQWRILWWGETSKGKKNIFKNMGQNLVYLPALFNSETHQLELAPYPLFLNTNGKTKILKPNFNKTTNAVLTRKTEVRLNNLEFNSLEFIENETLELFYWDKKWNSLGSFLVKNKAIQVSNIPTNALFKLLPNKPDHFERIFILTKEGKISWY